jgi:DNA-binding PadR family transcriptional regulator
MGMDAQIEANLPLTEATFFIMLSLSSGPMHGYAIMKEVQASSNGRIRLSTGTLYGALKRLLAEKWIMRAIESETEGSDRGRKAYTLTDLGRRLLRAEIKRLEALVSVAQQKTAGARA